MATTIRSFPRAIAAINARLAAYDGAKGDEWKSLAVAEHLGHLDVHLERVELEAVAVRALMALEVALEEDDDG